MKLNLSGTIKSRKKLQVDNQTCYGVTRGEKDKFSIYISEEALKDGYLFSETILHELLHLWFFILIAALDRDDISEKKQHEVLEQVIPIILSRTGIILKRKYK